MPQLGHSAVVEMPFMHLASGPDLLLSSGIALIQFLMKTELGLGGLRAGHQVSMVIRPSQKFSSSTLSTLQNIGGIPDACRCGLLLHGKPRLSMI